MQRLKLAVAIAFLFAFAFGHWLSASKLSSEKTVQLIDAPPLAELPTPLLDLLTLGHRGMWDDVASIWSLQFLADLRLGSQDPERLIRVLSEIARHEIRIESFYLLSCFILALEFRRPEACEPITQKGVKALPESWRIPFTEGFFRLSALGDKVKAAAYMTIAASRRGSPPYLARIVDRIKRDDAFSNDDLRSALELILQDDSKMGSLLYEKNLQQGSTSEVRQ